MKTKAPINQHLITNFNHGIIANLTTVIATVDAPAYLIDKRLLNELLSKVQSGTLDDIKERIITEVNLAYDKSDLFKRLDDYIYLDGIIQMVEPDIEDKDLVDAINVSAKKHSFNDDVDKDYR